MTKHKAPPSCTFSNCKFYNAILTKSCRVFWDLTLCQKHNANSGTNPDFVLNIPKKARGPIFGEQLELFEAN